MHLQAKQTFFSSERKLSAPGKSSPTGPQRQSTSLSLGWPGMLMESDGEVLTTGRVWAQGVEHRRLMGGMLGRIY